MSVELKDKAEQESAALNGVEGILFLKAMSSVAFIFAVISTLNSTLLLLLASAIGIFLAYKVTSPVQKGLLVITPFQGQWSIILPLLVFSLAWMSVLLKFDQGHSLNIIFPIFMAVVLVAFWPVYFRFSNKQLKPRIFSYKTTYLISMSLVLLIIIGLNYDKTFI